MEITFYSAPMSSALPVGSTLRELEVPHRRVEIDLASGEQRSPEFLARNPNGKVPTLVVDGTPMFEALAIMQWLGDRFGVESGLWPAADSPARLGALSWTTWAYVTFGSAVTRFYLASASSAPETLRSTAAAEHSRAELQQLLGVLEGQLTRSAHVASTDFSLVDLVVGSVVMWSEMVGVVTKDHPHVSAWIDRCKARPSIQAEWS
jgi:glutathione S-transferase